MQVTRVFSGTIDVVEEKRTRFKDPGTTKRHHLVMRKVIPSSSNNKQATSKFPPFPLSINTRRAIVDPSSSTAPDNRSQLSAISAHLICLIGSR